MTKKKIIIIVLILIILGAIYILIAQIYGNKIYQRDFKTFNESEIIGEIEKIGIKKHGTGFQLRKNSTEFVFYPNTSELSRNKIIYQIAEIGDSIIKHRHSDTLILLKGQEEYKYTFQKTEY